MTAAEDFEARLRESALEGGPPGAESVLTHLIDAGGKRVRKQLVFGFGELCGAPLEALEHLALAMEMLHAATLLHDDLIDNATSRRGRDALHRIAGPAGAVLVGDLYVARCGLHLAEIGDARVAAEVWGALDTVVRGEVAQTRRHFDLSQTEADYLETIRRKTASLLEAAAVSAALLGSDPAQAEAAREYARHVGLAFQVVDDVLDYTGGEQEIGKPVGNDIQEGTVTLPLIYTLEMSPAPVRAILDSAREKGDFSAVLQAVRSSGAIDRCLRLADEHSTRAIAALDGFPDAPARTRLTELAGSLPERRR